MSTLTKPLTLEEFLALSETKPASKFINGQIIQRPRPQGEHSRLQAKLCEAINRVAESQKLAYAFPELCCTFSADSIIPDVAVFQWSRIPIAPSGRIANRFEISPDWAIEILSPDQGQTKVLGNLLHCSKHGTALGWLIVPEEETVLVVDAEQRVQLLTQAETLPVLIGIALEITVEQVFGWLNFGG